MAERLADPAGAPPLSIWLLSCALVALVMISLWFWITGGKEKINPFLVSQGCEMASKPNLAGEKQSIIALGTSLLAFATAPAKKFETSLQEMRWQPCWVSGGTWNDLVRALPAIAALKPKILILHEGVLRGTNRDTLQQLFAEVFVKIKIGPVLTQPNLLLERPDCGLEKPLAASDYAVLLKHQAAIFNDVKTWIRRLEAAGTRVIVLDIPRSATLESQLSAVLTQRRVELQKLASDSGAQYWSFAPPSGPQAYCTDQAHMALEGRNQFAPQLAERLQHSFAESLR